MLSVTARRLASVAAPSFKRAALVASRPISSSAILKADHPSVPIIQGEGTPAGQVPTDEAQSTGLERCAAFFRLARPRAFWLTFSDSQCTSQNGIACKAERRGSFPHGSSRGAFDACMHPCLLACLASYRLTLALSSIRPSISLEHCRSHTWEHQRTQSRYSAWWVVFRTSSSSYCFLRANHFLAPPRTTTESSDAPDSQSTPTSAFEYRDIHGRTVH